MLRLKPTTIIALDPHAAALCEAVAVRLKESFGERGGLIQAAALVCDGGSLRFTDDLASIADASFDLEAARGAAPRPQPEAASEIVGNERAKLERELIERFSAGHRTAEIQAALRAGIEVGRTHVIMLVLSAADPFSRGAALEVTWLIRWLFATFFAEESFSLQAVVLLPSLLDGAGADDYAAAYALLKKFDYQIENGMIVMDAQPMPPFDYCWLLDSRNAQGNELGSLARHLDSYSDAFAGLLTTEPEMSGAAVSSHKVRGKVQAYSTFGHGELYLPAETAITRLSAALATDIITKAFLAGDVPLTDQRRKLLLAAKHFVLSQAFLHALGDLETDKGAQIWQPFDPGLAPREGGEHDYVRELNRRAEEFKDQMLLKYRETLETRREQVHGELSALLDAAIDHHADSDPNGLRIAAEWLAVVTDHAIGLEGYRLGDRPQNLVTEKRTADGALDAELRFAPDYKKSQALLEEISRLRNHLNHLRTTLRLLPSGTRDESPAHAEAGMLNAAPASDEQQKIAAEINTLEERLSTAEEEYGRAIFNEEKAAAIARYEASNKAREAKAAAVDEAQRHLYEVAEQWRAARLELEGWLEQRQLFARRYFIFYPTAALTLVFGLPAILAAAGIGPAQAWLGFYLRNLSSVWFWTILAALLYYSIVFIKFSTGINRLVKQAQDKVAGLKISFHSAAVMLRQAHNDQARLEYRLHAQQVRVETILSLNDAARHKAETLREKIAALHELCMACDQRRQQAVPYESMSRCSVLRAADIDAYYERRIADGCRDAEAFSREQIKRSQLRQMPIAEFQARLDEFTRRQFSRINNLTIEDVLLREHELISADVARQRLRELDDAAQPLLRLNDADANRAATQHDATLWAGVGEHEAVFALYRKICQEVTLRTHDESRSIRVLMRALYFPAYFLGQIHYYRHCYLAAQKEAELLPDLIPAELGPTGALRRAQERFLLAHALGLIEQRGDGAYYFGSGNGTALGPSRVEITRKLATDPTSQQIYSELCVALEKQAADRDLIYQRLSHLLLTTTNLESAEKDAIDRLIQRFHPLR